MCIVEAQMGDLKAQMGDFKAQRHQVMFGVFIWLAYGTTPLKTGQDIYGADLTSRRVLLAVIGAE